MVHTKLPQTLANIYSEEADQRDGMLPQFHGVPNTVDVFVSGPTGVGSTFHTKVSNVIGDCPYSHRVLLALEEKQVSYNLITIDRKLRPSWYYNVHPEAKVRLDEDLCAGAQGMGMGMESTRGYICPDAQTTNTG